MFQKNIIFLIKLVFITNYLNELHVNKYSLNAFKDFSCLRKADIRSVGCTNNDMSNPTAFKRSLTSVSLNNKFKGREFISVNVQVVSDNPSNVGVRADKPRVAAKLFGSISLISAVPPS